MHPYLLYGKLAEASVLLAFDLFADETKTLSTNTRTKDPKKSRDTKPFALLRF